MKNKPLNYLADLMKRNPVLAMSVCYALENAKTYDQVLAIARFSKVALQQDILKDVEAAVAEIGAGLDPDAAFKLTSKVAYETINDYSFGLYTKMGSELPALFNSRRHDA
jgi:hypothetical protein